MLVVLRNKNFLILWGGQVLSQLADRLLVAVLLLTVYEFTDSKLALSLPMLSFGLSAVFFGSIAGVFVDRWPKKKILIFSNALRALLVVSFFLINYLPYPLLWLFLISFLIFTIAQYFIPAESASIPVIIDKEHLLAANSFFMGTWMGATVVGFGAASLLSHLGFSLTTIYVCAAVLYLLASILIAFLSLPETITTKEHTIKGLIQELILGFAYALRKRTIRYSLIKIFIASSVLAILSELAIEFVHTVLGQNSDYFGYYVALAGLGMGFGILTLQIWHKMSRFQLSNIGFFISGLVLILIAFTDNFYLVLVLLFLLGMGNGYIMVPIQTILQEYVPHRFRGRVFSLQNVLISGAFTVPILIAAWLAEIYAVTIVFALAGGLTLVVLAFIELRLFLKPLHSEYNES